MRARMAPLTRHADVAKTLLRMALLPQKLGEVGVRQLSP